MKRPKSQRAAEKWLTVQEVKAMLALDLDPGERLCFDLFLDTTLRVGGLAAARIRDFRLDGDAYVLRVTLKGGRVVDKRLGDNVGAKLEATLRQREVRPNEPLLVDRYGEPYTVSAISRIVDRGARRAGITRIKVRVHVLRKAVATWPTRKALLSTVQKYAFACPGPRRSRPAAGARFVPGRGRWPVIPHV